MLFHHNGRFTMDSVSYCLPNNVYINTEFESEIATGFEIIDPNRRFRIDIKGELWDEKSDEFFEKYILTMGYDEVGRIEPIHIDGHSGHRLWYRGSRSTYIEYRFDLPAGGAYANLSIIIRSNDLTIPPAKLQREPALIELLNSLRFDPISMQANCVMKIPIQPRQSR